MVEADVDVNFDPHSRTNTTDPMPTNRPILPFLVLTMAGGCGVSNLMKQAGNNSWVCVCGNGVGGRGVKSRHKCPCQSRSRTRERERCTDRNDEPKMAASQSFKKRKETAVSLWAWLTAVTPLWLTEAGWAGTGSTVELRGLWGPEFVRAGFWKAEPSAKNCTGKCDTKSHRILNRLLISSCFHPSLRLSVWLGRGGLGLDYPRKGTWTWLCLFAHVL